MTRVTFQIHIVWTRVTFQIHRVFYIERRKLVDGYNKQK
jgi:hypothetical protein